MSNLISLSDIHKRHGAQTLFSGLNLQIPVGTRLGILGPNGAGKSTLLRLIADLTDYDNGKVLRQTNLRVSYAQQEAMFSDLEQTAFDLAYNTAARFNSHPQDCERATRGSLALMDIDFFDAKVSQLSGGQKKRLQIALCLSESPDLLLLDEPTNHLDIETIRSLEKLLNRVDFSWICVSHDRWFLENTVNRIAEINPRYPGGVFSVDGGYGKFCEKREQYLISLQNQQASLTNVVRSEVDWLRQGVKARTTKAKYRIDKAYQLLDSLNAIRARQPGKQISLTFDSSERKTKRLIELKNISKSFGPKTVVKDLTLTLTGGQALGILGLNGSGKTTLVKLLTGELQPNGGTITRASDLQISHFAQFDETLDNDTPLKKVLSENGESVVYRGESLHIASWAKRFRFSFELLQQPYGSLSGGERARARIARLMLTNPDVLILDEPTNDLDIETLEILEQSLIDFNGAVVLVSHDRFMINRVCTTYLGLDGLGNAVMYADYEQWDREVLQNKPNSTDDQNKTPPKQENSSKSSNSDEGKTTDTQLGKKRLGYLEQREYDGMETALLKAEQQVEDLQSELSSKSNSINSEQLQELCNRLAEKQYEVEKLYSRWAELEDKMKHKL